jgi:hypothetical protein
MLTTMLAALAAGFDCAFAILRKIARIVLRTSATVAVLTALAAGFCCPFPVVGKIARTVLPADLTGARRLLTILRKIPRIPRMSLVRHANAPSVRLTGMPVPTATEARGNGLSSRLP